MCKCRASSAAARAAAERTQASLPGPSLRVTAPSVPVYKVPAPAPAQRTAPAPVQRTAPAPKVAPTKVPAPKATPVAPAVRFAPAPKAPLTKSSCKMSLNRQPYTMGTRVYLNKWGQAPASYPAPAIQQSAPAPVAQEVAVSSEVAVSTLDSPLVAEPAPKPFIREATRLLATARAHNLAPQLANFLSQHTSR